MRIAVFDDYRIGVIREQGVHDVTEVLPGWTPEFAPILVNRFIAQFSELRSAVEEIASSAPARPIELVTLRPPVPRPAHIFAAPLNFRAHQEEMRTLIGSGDPTADKLGFFLKATGSLSGPAQAVELPYLPGRRFDHEGEVAFVIGKEARAVSRARALEHVFGYTILVDVTMRMTHTEREERVLRKSFSTFAPLGPCIVTADEVTDPAALRIRLWRNGELKQDARLRDLIVDVPGLIERASSVLPLQPGDVFATGSPAGVGEIQPGDEVLVEVAEIGRMRLPVKRREW
ncbi:MAG: fumarylacetoacetate hydrolase family protein [Acidobacteriota bacterium]